MGLSPKLLAPEGITYHPGLAQSHIHLHSRDYVEFPNPLPDGVIFVKSPKGTGKTQELSRLFRSKTRSKFSLTLSGEIDAEEPTSIETLGNSSALLIGHRIALIRQTCARLGLDFYREIVGNPTGKKLGISVDSLHRLTWRAQIASRLKNLVHSISVATLGEMPTLKRTIEFLEQQSDSEDVVSHLKERLNERDAAKRYYAVGFRNNAVRVVYPHDDDPLKYEEQITAHPGSDEGIAVEYRDE